MILRLEKLARLCAMLVAALCLTVRADAQSGVCASSAYRATSRAPAGTGAIAGNVALYQYFRAAWWNGQPAPHSWINWEQHEPFREMDKFGHAYGGYHLARIGSELLDASCVSRTKAVWWSAAYAAAFQLQIELWDGKQAEYGFSPFDLAANTAGASYAVAQHYVPALRNAKPTLSYSRTLASRRFGRPGQ